MEVIVEFYYSSVIYVVLINFKCLIIYISGKGVIFLEMVFFKVNILC